MGSSLVNDPVKENKRKIKNVSKPKPTNWMHHVFWTSVVYQTLMINHLTGPFWKPLNFWPFSNQFMISVPPFTEKPPFGPLVGQCSWWRWTEPNRAKDGVTQLAPGVCTKGWKAWHCLRTFIQIFFLFLNLFFLTRCWIFRSLHRTDIK